MGDLGVCEADGAFVKLASEVGQIRRFVDHLKAEQRRDMRWAEKRTKLWEERWERVEQLLEAPDRHVPDVPADVREAAEWARENPELLNPKSLRLAKYVWGQIGENDGT